MDTFGNPGGAATLTSGDGYTALTTPSTETVTPNTPYDSHQPINVIVQPNSVISATALCRRSRTTGLYYVEECSDPRRSRPPCPPGLQLRSGHRGHRHPQFGSSGGISLRGPMDTRSTTCPIARSVPTMTGSCDIRAESVCSDLRGQPEQTAVRLQRTTPVLCPFQRDGWRRIGFGGQPR